MGFRIVEEVVSGDFVFEAWGDSLKQIFESCAEATFSAMTDPSGVDPAIEHNFMVSADSIEDLLVDFLSELVFLKDTEKIFYADIDVEIDSDNLSLKAVARGEKIDYDKHEIRADVKAVTYHDLKIEKENDGFKTRVILDL